MANIVQTNSFTVEEYRASGLSFDLYRDFLSPQESVELYQHLIMYSKLKTYPNKRSNCTYGDKGLVYTIKFSNGGESLRRAIEWDPRIRVVKNKLEQITNQVYNVCVVQHYPSGNIGISPHRDKEMTPGTTICGLSLGQERLLTLQNRKHKLEVNLNPGSLYIMRPPTNDFYSHSIEKDETKQPRISLTFRNYIP